MVVGANIMVHHITDEKLWKSFGRKAVEHLWKTTHGDVFVVLESCGNPWENGPF